MIDAREVIAASQYVTLATADADGRPWASPVWFAHDDLAAVYWVSRPVTRHSRNLAARPALALVWFDSTAAPYTGCGVYADAVGGEVPGAEVDGAVSVFAARSAASGAGDWTAARVTGDAELRIYRARIESLWISGEGDRRVPVSRG